MALVNRLTRLFQADFHAVLDRIEDPELQLRQAVREMQLALDQDRQRLKLLQHEAAQIEKAVASAEVTLRNFDEELDICLAAEKDDLARDLVRRKLAMEKQRRSLEHQAITLEEQQKNLTRQIDEHGDQLSAMQQKLELLVSDDDHTDSRQWPSADAIRGEEIEIALLREKERRARA